MKERDTKQNLYVCIYIYVYTYMLIYCLGLNEPFSYLVKHVAFPCQGLKGQVHVGMTNIIGESLG